jgi:molecular chaperone DnaK
MTSPQSPIVGIDLGTTNSVIAVLIDGKVEVLAEEGDPILPSVVGIAPDGRTIVGQAARNQLAAFPDRTISSIKRKMGKEVTVPLGDKSLTPPEVSAIILRRLKQRAESVLGVPVDRAVITVPAFFDETQRQATRLAGELAGLKVERIINEPTAASLVYHAASPSRKNLIVYDLGGGTFDVSIVTIEAGVVEVLASRGNTLLGGDDFDEQMATWIADRFKAKHGMDLLERPSTRWRLMQACERAKCELSTVTSVRIAEEFIANRDGIDLHLDETISRIEYESLIRAMVDQTIQCVYEAIHESGLSLTQIDELLLVGGSTRTPLVQQQLGDTFRRDPRWAVNPDLAVALGAATQGALQAGASVGPVLIDVVTHTVGLVVFSRNPNRRDGLSYCPILRRNTPLPAIYEEVFYKGHESQKRIESAILQGEHSEIEMNHELGILHVQLDAHTNDKSMLVRFELTVDGTLAITSRENASGKVTKLQIDNALARASESIVDSKDRLASFYDGLEEFDADVLGEHAVTLGATSVSETSDDEGSLHRMDEGQTAVRSPATAKLTALMAQAKAIRPKLQGANGDDIDRLLGATQDAIQSGDLRRLGELEVELDDLLFYLAE